MVDRFLSYVRIDTQSAADRDTCPSTEKQWTLARQLVDELNEIGMSDVSIDENGYVLATLPGRAPGSVGFCAHYDTTPQFTGTGVNPQLHEAYDGTRIDVGNGIVLDPDETPELRACVGDTLITTDGTTLLGADDKAGIAEIMGAMEILLTETRIDHPTIRVCFNPDEEIGRGADRFPLERFDCPIAFTMDGGYSGDLNVETFSADGAVVTFSGVSVHPGTARGRLVNALTYMGKFLDRLPAGESPEATDERDGFFHPTRVSGDAARCSVDLILRDFDNDRLAQRGERVRRMAEALQAEEPRLGVEVEILEQYRNMFDVLREHPDVAEKMRRAVELAGVTPRMSPIRGGTDGSRLTAMGLPTPNIFAGGLNMHGPKECVSTRVMGEATCTILNLVQLFAPPGS
jgi:tripeptide aminopeptidase